METRILAKDIGNGYWWVKHPQEGTTYIIYVEGDLL
jgi:hypothetical protein